MSTIYYSFRECVYGEVGKIIIIGLKRFEVNTPVGSNVYGRFLIVLHHVETYLN
jgi:hypothetical protein